MRILLQGRLRLALLASVIPAITGIALLAPGITHSQPAEDASTETTQDPTPQPTPPKRKPAPKKPEVAAKKLPTEGAKIAGPTPQPQTEVSGSASQPGPKTAAGQAGAGSLSLSEPVQHANTAGIKRCGPLIAETAQANITTPHTAVSSWATKQPDAHMFQSIVGLVFPSTVAPKAAAILVASPEASGCEATVVQIHPTARSCGEIESELRKNGLNAVQLAGLPLTQSGTERKLLIPVPGTGCVVVGVSMKLNP